MKSTIFLIVAVLGTLSYAGSAPERCVMSMSIPGYPPLARVANMQGEVQVEILISASGEVTEAKVLSGHKMLEKATLENLKTWRYWPSSSNKPSKITVTYKYILDSHLTDGSDCCRFRMDGPSTVEVYAGPRFRTD